MIFERCYSQAGPRYRKIIFFSLFGPFLEYRLKEGTPRSSFGFAFLSVCLSVCMSADKLQTTSFDPGALFCLNMMFMTIPPDFFQYLRILIFAHFGLSLVFLCVFFSCIFCLWSSCRSHPITQEPNFLKYDLYDNNI